MKAFETKHKATVGPDSDGLRNSLLHNVANGLELTWPSPWKKPATHIETSRPLKRRMPYRTSGFLGASDGFCPNRKCIRSCVPSVRGLVNSSARRVAGRGGCTTADCKFSDQWAIIVRERTNPVTETTAPVARSGAGDGHHLSQNSGQLIAASQPFDPNPYERRRCCAPEAASKW